MGQAVFKVRRTLWATNKAQFGSSSNYTWTNTAGRLQMVGTARVYKDMWIPAQDWFVGETSHFAPAFGQNTVTSGPVTQAGSTSGSPFVLYAGEANASPYFIPALTASAAQDKNARAATAFIAPADAASSGSVQVFLYFADDLAYSTTGSMEVWRLRYNYLGTTGCCVGGQSGCILYGSCMLTTGCGALEVHTLGNIPSFSVAASPFVALELTLEGDNACAMNLAPTLHQILGMRLRYVAENLGVTTT